MTMVDTLRVPPDSGVDLVFAIVAGPDLHTDARHFRRYFDPNRPEVFKNGLDFAPLIRSARWAGWVCPPTTSRG